MKLQYPVSALIFAAVILSGCTANIPCSEIWRYRECPSTRIWQKDAQNKRPLPKKPRKGTFKKSEPKEW